MKKIELFINNILEKRIDYKELLFSIYDHVLNKTEAKKFLMYYGQAIKEGRLEEFKLYENIYINSFLKFYHQYNENILIHAIYDKESEVKIDKNYFNIKKYTNGIDTYYKCKSIQDFIDIIGFDYKEHLPFQNIIFTNHNIYIEFNFDMTFKIIFTEDEILFVEELKTIFLEGGFHLIGTA